MKAEGGGLKGGRGLGGARRRSEGLRSKVVSGPPGRAKWARSGSILLPWDRAIERGAGSSPHSGGPLVTLRLLTWDF